MRFDHEDWLTYKAQVYFVKADHNSMGVLDKPKVRRVDNRLAAELGVKPLCDSELVQALKDARSTGADGGLTGGRVEAQGFERWTVHGHIR